MIVFPEIPNDCLVVVGWDRGKGRREMLVRVSGRAVRGVLDVAGQPYNPMAAPMCVVGGGVWSDTTEFTIVDEKLCEGIEMLIVTGVVGKARKMAGMRV